VKACFAHGRWSYLGATTSSVLHKWGPVINVYGRFQQRTVGVLLMLVSRFIDEELRDTSTVGILNDDRWETGCLVRGEWKQGYMRQRMLVSWSWYEHRKMERRFTFHYRRFACSRRLRDRCGCATLVSCMSRVHCFGVIVQLLYCACLVLIVSKCLRDPNAHEPLGSGC